MTVTALRDLLISWAEINSGSDNIAGLEQMRQTLAAEFATLPGGRVEHLDLEGTAAKVLRIRVRPDAPLRILFSGHYDTVYSANDPFQHCTLLDADTLRGPGVTDMKGGLVVMLAALREFARSPHAARIGYEVLLTPDEETGSIASRPWLDAAASSGNFAFGLVYEPARPNGDIVHSRKGTANFIATCHGKAAHAASPIRAGRNAIIALSEFLLAADRLPAEMPGVMFNVGSIRGGGAATNVVPDFAQALIDVRITRAADREPLLAHFKELAAPINARDGFRLEITGGFNRPPKECGPLEEKLITAWKQCGLDVGLPPFTSVHTGGASDGNFLSAAGLPNIDGLGPIGDRLHSAEEFIKLSTIPERASVTARFLEKLASGAITL